ncbi:MAG: leucine-rich repeat domain-containing protein [Promethearchaeota archaeon]
METTKAGKLDAMTGATTVSSFSQPSNLPPTKSRGTKATDSGATGQDLIPDWKRKYDFNLELGKAALQKGKLDDALENYESAYAIAQKNYDVSLALEAKQLVEKAQDLKREQDKRDNEVKIQARLDDARSLLAAGNWHSALQEFKALEKECKAIEYQAGVQTARDYIAMIEREYKKMDYHGTQLIARDYSVMVDLEHLIGEPIPKVSKVEHDTFGFVAEDGHVVQLGLYKKRLTSLPETIGNLQSLTYLNLHGNLLTSIPQTIGNLKSLETLNLWNNQLKSLPETIGNLKSLKELDIRWSKLKALPESIGNLKNLKILTLNYELSMKLPKTTKQTLKNLEKEGCKIKSRGNVRTGDVLFKVIFSTALILLGIISYYYS